MATKTKRYSVGNWSEHRTLELAVKRALKVSRENDHDLVLVSEIDGNLAFWVRSTDV